MRNLSLSMYTPLYQLIPFKPSYPTLPVRATYPIRLIQSYLFIIYLSSHSTNLANYSSHPDLPILLIPSFAFHFTHTYLPTYPLFIAFYSSQPSYPTNTSHFTHSNLLTQPIHLILLIPIFLPNQYISFYSSHPDYPTNASHFTHPNLIIQPMHLILLIPT